MHLNQIIHWDLKSNNILINDNMLIKIADFGISRHINVPNREYSKEIMTLYYWAPEILIE